LPKSDMVVMCCCAVLIVLKTMSASTKLWKHQSLDHRTPAIVQVRFRKYTNNSLWIYIVSFVCKSALEQV
jgi:hypothetical protein